MNLGITKYKLIIAVFIIVLAAIILYMNIYLESFIDVSPTSTNLFNDSRYEKNRTLLYGSLFLDNLDKQIKSMTDPRIQYDNKRIDIIKYSDALL